MKPGTNNRIAGERHEVRGKVKKTAGQVTKSAALGVKGKAKSRTRKTQDKGRQATEVFDRAAALRPIRLVASNTFSPPASMVTRIARWPGSFAAWGKALLSSLLRMTESFFSYLANAIRSISISRLYKQRSPQAA